MRGAQRLVLSSVMILVGGMARAEIEPTPPVEIEPLRSGTWPYALDLNVVIGIEPHDRGDCSNLYKRCAIAFGVGAEVLWHGRVGAFLSLLSSEGSPVVAQIKNNRKEPSLPDRISIPLGVTVRPLVGFGGRRSDWLGRLLSGVGAQVGPSIEYLRTSDDSSTQLGLHAAVSVDVPIYGGPIVGGVALRLAARMIVAKSVTLDASAPAKEDAFSGQLFAGLSYSP